MKKYFILAFCCLFSTLLLAQQGQTGSADQSEEKVLYSLGYLLGNNVKEQLILDNEDAYKSFSQGMRDSLLGRKSQTNLDEYKPLITKKYQEDKATLNAKRKAAQDDYLAEVKKDKKSKVLSNGAVIQMERKGKGKNPKAADTVKVHYTGKMIDGTVFDSSISRGVPAEFPLNGVIPCWTIGLQEMKPGSKATLFCPPDTAYGNRQAGPISPNSLLIFNVELLEVK